MDDTKQAAIEDDAVAQLRETLDNVNRGEPDTRPVEQTGWQAGESVVRATHRVLAPPVSSGRDADG
jgi:hypothetical protein